MRAKLKETMRDRFHTTVEDLLRVDPRTVVVLAAIGSSRFSADLRGEVGGRIIDVGIREQTMIGVAGGLALEGMRPIVMSYAPFLVERPFEQIKISLTHQGVAATLVSVGASWDASTAGRTHQAPEDVALMATLPGWTVHVPGSPGEAEAAIRGAVGSDGSHYIRLTDDANARDHEGGVGGVGGVGRISTLRRGSDDAPTVLAVGPTADDVLLAVEGTDTTVLYTTVPHPIDARGLRASVLGADLVVVEPYLAGTSLGDIAPVFDRPMRIRSIGVTDPELPRYGTPGELKHSHGLDEDGIRSSLARLWSRAPV